MAPRPVEHGRVAARTAVVWDSVLATVHELGTTDGERALRVIDLGGGTGGIAVRIAELGHHVLVVDPSLDALASLHRRAVEAGVDDRVRGVQGDATELGDHIGADLADLVLCHGVLEVVDDAGQALTAAASAVRPGGYVSIVVAGRLAAVFGRALAGDLGRALALLSTASGMWDIPADGPRRFTREEITALLTDHGLEATRVEAVRVFTDLVPSAVVESEPGARQALLDLERAVAGRPEFSALAGQHHLIARRPR